MLVQYRDKVGAPQDDLRDAAVMWEVFDGSGCRLMMNDRADLAVLAGFGGVHVGQGDLSPEDARRGGWVRDGTSWVWGFYAYDEQVRIADADECGLYRCWAGVCYGDEGGCGAGDWVGGGAAGAGVDGEADCGDWRDYAGECAECD